MHMHGIQRRGGAGRRIFQPLLCLLLACALFGAAFYAITHVILHRRLNLE